VRVVRTTVGVIGELAITAGVVLLLFVVWQLGYVAVTTNRAQAATVESLERRFGRLSPSPSTGSTPTDDPTVGPAVGPAAPSPPALSGDAFAILRIPRLGAGWAKPVYQGVGADVLAEGIGHYPGTQLPGAVGNAGFAGHRAGHGNPLIDIDTLRAGDAIVVETADAYVVYRAVRSEIVPPTDVRVLDPVPEQPGATPTESWLTLTSCEPKYGSTNRYIVFARLDRSIPRDQGLPADVLAVRGGDG
jgi:sortase A